MLVLFIEYPAPVDQHRGPQSTIEITFNRLWIALIISKQQCAKLQRSPKITLNTCTISARVRFHLMLIECNESEIELHLEHVTQIAERILVCEGSRTCDPAMNHVAERSP